MSEFDTSLDNLWAKDGLRLLRERERNARRASDRAEGPFWKRTCERSAERWAAAAEAFEAAIRGQVEADRPEVPR